MLHILVSATSLSPRAAQEMPSLSLWRMVRKKEKHVEIINRSSAVICYSHVCAVRAISTRQRGGPGNHHAVLKYAAESPADTPDNDKRL